MQDSFQDTYIHYPFFCSQRELRSLLVNEILSSVHYIPPLKNLNKKSLGLYRQGDVETWLW